VGRHDGRARLCLEARAFLPQMGMALKRCARAVTRREVRRERESVVV
jgi:hypothetical protein